MGLIYTAISKILLFWHAAWHRLVDDVVWLGTNWSWILAIIFLVLTVRALLFPIFVKQIKSQRAMQAMQPKVKALQEKHKGDRESLQKELMELYRSEGTNPLMGCLPMFLQIPVFLGLFHVLRHLKPTMSENLKTLYGWTIGQFDSASHAKLFGAPISSTFRSSTAELATLHANPTTVKIVAGVLVAIMICTTFLTSRQMILKTGWSEDPQQRMIQRLMLYGVPFSLLISGTLFPIGVVIYWVVQNLFSLGQQMWVLRKYPPPKMTGAAAGKASGTGAVSSKSGPGPARSGSGLAKAGSGKATSAKVTKSGDAKDDKNGAAPTIDGKALAPKVGAKPVNPKKGGPAKKS
jgi:YidC/Oxa1 family membrane protein insertase